MDIIKLLEEEGAPLETVDNYNLSVLHVSTILGNIDAADYALRSGISVDCKCTKGITSLMYAIMLEWIDMIILLMQSGANINEQDNDAR